MSLSQYAELAFLAAFGCYVALVVLATHGLIRSPRRPRIPAGRHFRRRR